MKGKFIIVTRKDSEFGNYDNKIVADIYKIKDVDGKLFYKDSNDDLVELIEKELKDVLYYSLIGCTHSIFDYNTNEYVRSYDEYSLFYSEKANNFIVTSFDMRNGINVIDCAPTRDYKDLKSYDFFHCIDSHLNLI